MGYYLAAKIKEMFDISEIDYVVPVPDTSKPCAQAMSKALKIPYHEVLIKNRYMSRTFIMNCQENRKKNIKRKFGVVKQYITGKSLLVVDDSIVRGNTIGYIIELLKKCDARKIYVASCSPPVKFNNVHGIDIPDTKNLIANKMTVPEMQRYYNIDGLIYQDLDDLRKSITDLNPNLSRFETQVFNKN
jgi:amidophosphoribosyltransferase